MGLLNDLQNHLQAHFGEDKLLHNTSCRELTLTLDADELTSAMLTLRDDENFAFDQLIDVCGVDYFAHGMTEWKTEQATNTGFSRAVNKKIDKNHSLWQGKRFATVYHLLSLQHNWRLRVRVMLDEQDLRVASVNEIWPAANWFEREAFDLFGILFEGHPDLRRILTDYGFVGHPMRKDFPVSGHVEMRYDAKQQRVIYEPVDIQDRTLVPKVIREDSRYQIESIPTHKEDPAHDK